MSIFKYKCIKCQDTMKYLENGHGMCEYIFEHYESWYIRKPIQVSPLGGARNQHHGAMNPVQRGPFLFLRKGML